MTPEPEDTETVAFTMRLHPGQEQEYKRRHDEIWPELAAALRASGILDYRIFLHPDTRVLFATMTRRRNHTVDSLPGQPVMRRWWATMADIMDTNADGSPLVQPLTDVFRLG